MKGRRTSRFLLFMFKVSVNSLARFLSGRRSVRRGWRTGLFFSERLVVKLLCDQFGPVHVVLEVETRVVQVGRVDQGCSDVLGYWESTAASGAGRG